jgi:hypothetical protein
MGQILSSYKKSTYDEMIYSIQSNSTQYYAFASNPITTNGLANLTLDGYSTEFTNNWQMLFGKKLSNSDILPVITQQTWVPNTVYNTYDNTKDLSNKVWYVVTPPGESGSFYNIFVCIDNNNNSYSTAIPDIVQSSAFTKEDGYTWKYVTSIRTQDYVKFGAKGYMPVYANVTAAAAASNAGVEIVKIVNSGSGYKSYTSGVIKGVVNSTMVQIETTKSPEDNFYTNNAIYIQNELTVDAGIFTVTGYRANQSGNFISLANTSGGGVNTSLVIPGITTYSISPRVLFDTDGTVDPEAYTTINAVSNSINSVVITNHGAQISWANARIVSNSSYGTGANIYVVVPPPGGSHASDPTSLGVVGVSMVFSFANTEANTITVNTTYNKIGLLKNPYGIYANGEKSVARYSSNTFSTISQFTINSGDTFTVGESVSGNISGARGTVVWSNSTALALTGDKYFTNEQLTSSSGQHTATVTINTNGDIYTKDIRPLYVQNIYDVQRSNTQTETFKLIITS